MYIRLFPGFLFSKPRRVIFFVAFLLLVTPVYAVSEQEEGAYKEIAARVRSNHVDWVMFPITLQVAPYEGTTKDPFLLAYSFLGSSSNIAGDNLRGINVNIGILQIDPWLLKYFNCYPKVGLDCNYGSVKQHGSGGGAVVYVEPLYDYLTNVEIFPRFGIGGASFPNETENSNYVDFLMGIGLDVKLTSHWQVVSKIDWHYLLDPHLLQEERLSSQLVSKISVGGGYAFNPCSRLLPHHAGKRQKEVRVNTGVIIASREFDKNRYGVFGGYGQVSFLLYKNHALLIGGEAIIFDPAVRETLKSKEFKSPIKVGVSVGHEFRLGSISVSQQIVADIINNEKATPSLSLRGGIDWQFTDSWSVGIGPKGNIEGQKGLKLERMEVRIGRIF